MAHCSRETRPVQAKIGQALFHLSGLRAYSRAYFSVENPDCCRRVMGATGSGKTQVSGIHLIPMDRDSPGYLQFINLASGSNLPVGMGLRSCTADVQLADEFTLEGRTVTLIDTPGFDDTSKSDTDILKLIAAFLATT